ncbi:MAG: Ppx/GppA phosphatase family protein [Spirochaetota bacterium]
MAAFSETDGETRLIAIIDIGSTAIRMVVVEIKTSNEWKILERVGKTVPLGKDVFVTGKISRETMALSIKIIASFKELLKGWQITDRDIRVIATTAIREANNKDIFIDRVAVRTGLKISIVEGIEENRLTYMAVQWAIKELKPQLARSNSIIIEVGGGSTELMLLQRSRMVAAHSLHIGTSRIEQQIKSSHSTSGYLVRFFHERIGTMREMLDAELKLKRIRYYIAVGGDARLAASKIGRPVNELYSVIEKPELETFVKEIQNFSIDEVVHHLQISYHDAEGLVSGLLIYLMFMDGTNATQLIVPNVSIREGMLLSITMGPDPEIQENFYDQVIASALNLGRKYHFDEKHARHVSRLALKLFDSMREEHGFGNHSRLLLEIAGLLHDIGTFVHTSSHHKHGQYLVSNSDIFGMHRDDIKILSNVVRYHRKTMPLPSHRSYISLSMEERIRVMKLAAILRVADALDRGHTQRIKNFSLKKTENELILTCEYKGDISLERFGLTGKAGMYEDVFGLKVILV